MRPWFGRTGQTSTLRYPSILYPPLTHTHLCARAMIRRGCAPPAHLASACWRGGGCDSHRAVSGGLTLPAMLQCCNVMCNVMSTAHCPLWPRVDTNRHDHVLPWDRSDDDIRLSQRATPPPPPPDGSPPCSVYCTVVAQWADYLGCVSRCLQCAVPLSVPLSVVSLFILPL